MATDPVTSACTQVAVAGVVSYMKTQLGYVRNYKTNFENLRTQLQKLNDARVVVQHQVEEAKRKGDGIEQQVVNWLGRVEEINAEVTKIVEDNNPANMRCFKSLCPDLKKRCQHSKEAARKTDDISKLQQEGTFERVWYRTLPAETWDVDGYENIESRRSTLEGILNTLLDPDVDMVGVYGIGGSGKTTLVKQVAKKAEQDMLFDTVVFVEVSEAAEIARIQGEIAERLGLPFNEHAPRVRADRLRERIMKESKMLLILDDIWKDLDLAAVGIPYGNNHVGCRLLLTSRDMDLLKMMGSKTNFPVEILEEEEACNLFMKIAGVGEEQRDLRPLAIEVAKKCGGLLVAIITIAKALRDKPENEWTIALRELCNPPFLEDVEGAVVKTAYASISLSYKNLGSGELRSTFLLCSIMGCPKDASIEELLRYAVGLGLFKAETTVADMRDKVKKLVRTLKDASLLLGTPNGETFSIHDVIHDVGRWIAYSQQHKFSVINNRVPRSWAAENIWEKCTAITLHDIVELPKSLECPQLKFFYMKTKVQFTKVPDEFFEGMLNLEVLHFVEMDLLILPESLCLLRHLRTLNLDMCRVGDVVEIKDMKHLEILVISSGNKIKQLSEEIGRLTSLRLLDLRKSSFIIPLKTISRLTQLEELYMDHWYDQREVEELNIEINVASLEELKDLCHLTALQIRVADAEILSKCRVFQNLKRYNILIQDKRAMGDTSFFEHKRAMGETLRTLQVRSNTDLCSEDGVIKQLKGIENLLLDGEQKITNVLCELDGEGFPKLKHFRIKNNPSILCIIDLMSSATCVAFPLLETLSLSNLVGLEKICRDQLKTKCFCQLRTIKVRECHKLKNLFSFSIAKHLVVLQEIKVVDCENIEEVFFVDGANVGVIDPEFYKQLHSLTLRNLPRLRRICSDTEVASTSQERRMPLTMNASSSEIVLEDQLDALPLLDEKVVFPNLKSLELHNINVKRIWPNQLPSLSCSVQNLTTMNIKKCCNLKYVFSSSTLGSFNHLQHLEIADCKDLEELIRVDEKCNDYVEFPSLETLHIDKCPELREFIFSNKVSYPSLQEIQIIGMDNLRRIWESQVIHSFQYCPKLCEVRLDGCKSLENIFLASIARTLLQLEVLDVKQCGIKEIVAKEGVEEAVATFSFPQLTSLYLDSLGELSCFYPGKHNTELPKLKKLKVEHCKKIDLFSYGKHDVEGQLDDDHIVQQPLISIDQVVFPNLKSLELHNINVKRIWPNQLPSLSCLVQNLTMMDIKKCRNLKYVFSSSTLGSFNHLQHLEITDCKDLEELIRVDDKCNNYVEFPSLERLDIDKCPKLREFIFNNKVSCPSLQEIEFRFMDNLRRIWESQVIQSVEYCPKLCKVRLIGCRSLEYIFPASIARRLLQLKVLDVDWSRIKEIVAKEGGVEEADAKFSFPQLTSLYLRELEELRCFYPGKHNTELPKLKELKVEDCKKIDLFSCKKHDVEGQLDDDHTVQQPLLSVDQAFLHLEKVETSINHLRMTCQSSFLEYLFSKLKSLKVRADESTIFPHSIFEKFHNLEELQLEYSSYKEIFSGEEIEKHVGMFAQLKKLHLSYHSNLKQIWKQESKMDLIIQKLEFLEVSWCDNLINLMPPSAPFKNLKILKVYKCDGLLSLVPDSAANSLMVLEEMSISCCKKMTEIIENQGDVMEGKIILSRLKSLELKELTNLTSFYSGNHTIIFPLLEELEVYNCTELKFFSLGVMSTPNLEAVSLRWTNYKCKHHNLNAIFREIRDKAVFSILEQSFLSSKNLRLVWNSFPKYTKVFSNAKQLMLSGNDIGMMWQSQLPEIIFPKLKCLDVFNDTSTVFPFGIFERFHNLKKLELQNCSYEEIFSYEDVEKYAWSPPQIKCLRLACLREIKQIWKKNSKLNLHQNLESLEVEGCVSLNNVLLPPSSFENLKIMKVNNCKKLISLMVASTTKSLVQLEEMQISKCEMMTQVVANGGDIVQDKITFNKLKTLKLKYLSCLTGFSFGNYNFEIPVLEKLTVKECPQMEIFALGNLSTPTLREIWQDQTQYVCKDDLNEIVRQHHEEMIFSRKKLNFKNIIKMLHKISEHQKVFSNLEQLSFRRDEISVLCQSQFPQQLFPKLKLLEVFEDESIVFPLAVLQKFRSVEKLDLNCSSYEEIFSYEDFEKYEGASTQTKWLRLHQLDNLKQMWKQDSSLDLILQNVDDLHVKCCGSLVTLMPPSSSFQNLTNLSVDGCDRLMNLLAPATAKSLVQLQYMDITNCKMMTEVIPSDEEAVTGDEIIFNKLRWLQLEGLSSLKSFCPGNYTFTFPCLSTIYLENCPKIKFFSLGVLNTPSLSEVRHDNTKCDCVDGLNATIQGIHEKLNAKTSPEDCAGPSTLSSSGI